MRQKTGKGLAVCLLIVSIFMAGCGSGNADAKKSKKSSRTFDRTAVATVEKIVRYYEAVGTLRPETEASIEAQVKAQIRKMHVAPGAEVVLGQPLIQLDDLSYISMLDRAKEGLRSAKAQREQARQGLEASKAALAQADAEYQRTQKFFKSQAATKQQLENAESAWKQARAGEKNSGQALKAADSGVKQAEELVRQAEITLGYTLIKAPANGVVLKKMADPGDLALPGRPLLLLRTNNMLRIEANVREGLIGGISVGQTVDVDIKNLKVRVKAIVDEIEPFADPQTRTFLVKAALPEISGAYPGMYGKLLIPETTEEGITLPPETIRTVGQLRYVHVREGDRWYRRFITIGGKIGERVEVLSGLNGNEIVGY